MNNAENKNEKILQKSNSPSGQKKPVLLATNAKRAK